MIRLAPLLAPLLVLLLPLSTFAQSENDIRSWVAHYSAEYGADPVQLARVAACESGMRADATSPWGDRGVFQFERRTWEELAPQIGVSGDFDEAYSAPSNIAVASYSFAAGLAHRWTCR